MNIIKVYNKEGKVVDSYVKPQKKENYWSYGALTSNSRNRAILATEHYVKGNLPK